MTTKEQVVVSGISGRLPESDNIAEFREHLVNGDDMVTETDRRWTPGLFGLPRRSGTLEDISKFDAAFFGVHPKQADCMDPQLRMLLEVTYESLIDAGVNPVEARGSNTGVFIGSTCSESHEQWTSDPESITGYELTGCCQSMFANRISYSFDFKGPSLTMDTACSSSLLALDQALHSIWAGKCDAAVVGGCSLCLKPQATLQFLRFGMLSPEGACKSFDASADGFCRSEGIVAIYIQKETHARRKYATIVNSGNNSDGHKKEGITFPSGEEQKRLLQSVYAEACVSPAEVSYVEAHGTGTKAGDPQELGAIVDVFCAGRQGPLLIGSTKSNMGHPEPASGLAALAKVLIAMEDGHIPANLHYKSPNPDIPALVDGRLKVVTEHTPWQGGYVGINSFGFGGSNVHVLLLSNSTAVTPAHPASNIPRLVTWSGRTQEVVKSGLESIQAQPGNVDMQAIIQESATAPAQSHPYRGYALVNHKNKDVDVQHAAVEGRPTWFVFSGMGTQWHGMGRDLMGIEAFHQSITRSDAVLQQHGISLLELITSGDETVFENTLNSFVSIVAIQVALVDVLTSLGILPDGFVGHSVGELGCAYADGGLTADEAVLAAYWRGRCIQEANLPPGGMAAVGLTWEEAKVRCPEGVVPACHNSVDTVTVSGPLALVNTFVTQLQEEGVFARNVNSAGVAFHSYFMDEVKVSLKSALRKVICEQQPRTARWVSSSIPEAHWGSELAAFSSAEYHVNNLVSPVLFQEALQHIPQNAVTIEIAPHCLLQAILKRSLSAECALIGLMKRNHPDNLEFFLTNLGKLFQEGVNFNPLKLYAPVSFPVAHGTPMVGPLVGWDHSQTWKTPKADLFISGGSGGKPQYTFEIDVLDGSEYHFLVDHMIDGRVLFPAAGYLVLVWQVLAKISCQTYNQMPVEFKNVVIHEATILPKAGKVTLEVSILPESGEFEVCAAHTPVVSGRIISLTHDIITLTPDMPPNPTGIPLTGDDIYKELRLRGYEYGPAFQGILSANYDGNEGYLNWSGNWISFMDSMLQMQVLGLPDRSLRLPTRIRSLCIDPMKHNKEITDKDHTVKVVVEKMLNVCVSGGIEIKGLSATLAPRLQGHTVPTLEKCQFVPYCEENLLLDDLHRNQYLKAIKAFLHEKLSGLVNSGHQASLEKIEELVKFAKNEPADTPRVDLQRYLSVPGCGFADTLHEIFQLDTTENFAVKVKEIIRAHNAELSADQILAALLHNEHSLKTCLDVVWENNASNRELKIAEVGASSSQLFTSIIPQLYTQPLLNFISYIACDKEFGDLNEAILDGLGVETIEWDHTTEEPCPVIEADLLVTSHILSTCKEEILEKINKLSAIVKDDGFLLFHEPVQNHILPMSLCALTNTPYQQMDVESICSLLKDAELEIVAQKTDGLLSGLFLCRKTIKCDDEMNTLLDVSDLSEFSWVSDLKDALAAHRAAPPGHKLWLVATSRPESGIVGMVNCLRLEQGGNHLRCIFGADEESGKNLNGLKVDSATFKELTHRDLVMNICCRGKWGSFRHTTFKQVSSMKSEHAHVDIHTRGDLSSLRWIESHLKYFHEQKHEQQELCSVYYASLNFRDVMLATGKLPADAIPGNLGSQDCLLGMEFSGRDKNGKRIMGIVPAKGLATTVSVDPHFLWPVPEEWTLEQAASLPVVYTTVYYALIVRGQIQHGDKVLIHSGSSGVGQAAIAIALHQGCEVYTTVGSNEKRQYLKDQFPLLKDHNIYYSRDTSFEIDILRATGGQGVDVILNSLTEEKLQASVRILAQHGRFLEIGKYDLSNNMSLGMAVFLKNISFHGILLDALFDSGKKDWKQVTELFTKGLKSGVVIPLNTTVFERDNVVSAFRLMAQGKHIGKVLIKIRDEEMNTPHIASTVQTSTFPRTACHPQGVYIITGGLGGFGLELANWLVSRGATRLILTSRFGIQTGYQARCVANWKAAGVMVSVVSHNVTPEGTQKLIKEAKAMGPVDGVFHLAMVLHDAVMENQTVENFVEVAEQRVAGTLQLDLETRAQCPNLKWFVVFSSASSGRGNIGQANYGFASSTLERVCELRHKDGLPGLAIQWGAIGDVGVVVDNLGHDAVVGGTLPQRINSCLEVLDQMLNQPHPVVSSLVCAPKQIKTVTSGKDGLAQAVGNILGVLDVTTVNGDVTLADLGLDSLMKVEVRQTLEQNYNKVLALAEIGQLTFNKLQNIDKREAVVAVVI